MSKDKLIIHTPKDGKPSVWRAIKPGGPLVGYELVKMPKEKAEDPWIGWVGAKIPLSLWRSWLAFSQFIYDRDKSECQANLMYNFKEARWDIWVAPQERATGMTAREIDSDASRAQRASLYPEFELTPEGRTAMGADGQPVRLWLCMGSVHTHCSAAAFQSGTDSQNEKSRDGIHLTIGHQDKPVYDLHSRVYYKGVEYGVNLDEWFESPLLEKASLLSAEVGIEMDDPLIKKILTKELTTKAPDATVYPSLWVENIIARPPVQVVSQRVYRGKGWPDGEEDGRWGYNASCYGTGFVGSGWASTMSDLARMKSIDPTELTSVIELLDISPVMRAILVGASRRSIVNDDAIDELIEKLDALRSEAWKKDEEMERRIDRQLAEASDEHTAAAWGIQ